MSMYGNHGAPQYPGQSTSHAARRRPLGVAMGLFQALGATVMVILFALSESWNRLDLSLLDDLPDLLGHDFTRKTLEVSNDLIRQDWYQDLAEFYDTVTFGQSKYALLALTVLALALRLANRSDMRGLLVLLGWAIAFLGLLAALFNLHFLLVAGVYAVIVYLLTLGLLLACTRR